MCVLVSIIEKYSFQWVENTRMMAMNPLHSSDQGSLLAFGHLLNHNKHYSFTMFMISNIIF